MHDVFPINTDSVVNAFSTNCRKELKTPREALVYVTDGGYATSNSQVVASSVTNNFISVQAKLSFIMLLAQNMPLAETFLKEAHLKETERCFPERRPPAHVLFFPLNHHNLYPLSSLSLAPESSLSSPCASSCPQHGSRWQSQNTVFTHMGSYEALRST